MRWSTIAIVCSTLLACAPAKRADGGFAPDPRSPRPVPNRVADGYPPAAPPDHPAIAGYAEQRAILVEILEDMRDPNEQADVLMRLADLARTMAESVDQRAAEIRARCGGAGCGSDDRRGLERLAAVSRRLVDDEVAWLDLLVREHETYSRADEALYRLGALQLEHDQPEVALRQIRTLIARYPASRWVSAAYLAFGDHFFDRGEIDKAAKLYEKVLVHRDSATAPYAHHKLGWCHYNKQDFKRALESFVDALDAIQVADAPGLGGLRDQVLEDLVRAYARVGKPQMAEKFFERFAGEQVDELLEHLARFYFEDGKYAEAIQVHRRLVERVECSTVQARSQLGIFEARLLLGDREGMIGEARRLAEVFVQLGECLPPEQLVEFAAVGVEAKESLKEQAAQFRAEFDVTQAPAAAMAAEELEQAAAAF